MSTPTDPSFATVVVDTTGPIGSITLDRPEKLNPLGTDTLLELIEAARTLDRADDVKVVVVSGAGRAFSAGADVGAFSGSPQAGLDPREAADAGRRMAESIEAMEAVTIARVHGHCIGGGVVLAAACDLRVAASDANFAIPEVDLGIPLAWGGIPRLVREIGPAATKDLVLSCRSFRADEARGLGLVNRVVAPEALVDEVDALAGSLASKSTLTLRQTKRAVAAAARELVDPSHSWSDADALVTALGDEESRAAAHRYLEGLADR